MGRRRCKAKTEHIVVIYSTCTMFVYMQLYIKVSEDLKQQTGSDTVTFSDEDTDSSQAGAMELLDPHLPRLSQYWLAAVKDHAYLSLPPQFSSQLPPSGGTFYNNDVMDCVKPYYQDNWPSLLHAAAIWLASGGFDTLEKSASTGTLSSLPPPQLVPSGAQMLPPPAIPPLGGTSGLVPGTDARRDYFHLILGLSVQALCTPATLDEPQTVTHCLRAVKRLFKAAFSRGLLSSDSQLSIEVLSVMHRLLLTCQSKAMHTVALEVASFIGEALKASLVQST